MELTRADIIDVLLHAQRYIEFPLRSPLPAAEVLAQIEALKLRVWTDRVQA